MTDVTIRRLKKKTGANAPDRSATLVLPDGCRNPAYKVSIEDRTLRGFMGTRHPYSGDEKDVVLRR